ncbi:translation initiation factor 3 [Neokomagataea thailandica NBRC 106555]|uniref:Translation initiation factor IF-3 n=2 Tax=Neokomagataea TaxID=1223423 RepID=A0A4Y6V8W9_9PROT|nr:MULTISPECIES: translation initiation factor IF-3 [Neokomagataea]QDH24966.1 translation initiation factor IF-3 [Neokomagataea tanensis]GBR51605.1 translation initiation factor 3 [Neokomagataea thailandica NBRC 106555]
MQSAPTREGPRVNEEIRVPQVRLIDEEGEMQGIMSTRDALTRAFASGLDLLEISPTAVPPVVKILDYGKFKYEQQKKKNEARKKQKVIEIKEVKVRPGTGEHDFQTKLKAIHAFLDAGDKVKVSLRFKGREMAHQELGAKMMERIRIEVEEKAKIEQMPRLENRQMLMVMAPR